ncbi:MAG TPA: BTAD domain-containing putative transcriptional regulator [Vicinamibacterales bacterium]|nr:BTAD domain-containing putative transcriptional regulator [Vicinamibacterales bacterium]
MHTLRIYLTGSVAIEHGDLLVREKQFPGRQGRIAFVFLVLNRHRSVHREELMGAIWPNDAPQQTDAALDAILSKLRSLLKSVGFAPGAAGIQVSSGNVAVQLPADAWIDIEAAANALDEAEGALRRRDAPPPWSLANIAVVISRRPLLSDVEAPWIESQRSTLRAMQMRALQCLVTVSANNGESALAIQHATEMVSLDPFKETAYQLLMKMHAAAGDRAEALRVFARCRELLRDELGVSPSPHTEAVYLEILRAEAS